MKKSLKIAACAVLALLVSFQLLAQGEAAPKRPDRNKVKPARFARVAILPVINLQEDVDYANTLVFQKALEVFRYPDYEIYDDDKVYKALDEINYYEAGKQGVTEEMLRTVMQKSGVEVIVMVKLNELTQEKYRYGREDTDELTIDMNVMAIYSWDKKIVNWHIRDKKQVEYGAIMKSNWKMQTYGNYVDQQLTRIAKRGMQ